MSKNVLVAYSVRRVCSLGTRGGDRKSYNLRPQYRGVICLLSSWYRTTQYEIVELLLNQVTKSFTNALEYVNFLDAKRHLKVSVHYLQYKCKYRTTSNIVYLLVYYSNMCLIQCSLAEETFCTHRASTLS